MRQPLVCFILSMLTAAAAAETPLSVPSDPKAKYYVLERDRGGDWQKLLTRRVGPSGVKYAERTFDCRARTVPYFVEADNLQALRSAKPDRTNVPIVNGSVDHDLWIEVWVAGRTPEDKRSAERRAEGNRRMELERRIQQSRPYRRESPLRAANVSDGEVQEIKLSASDVLPGAIVNIGGVVTGCPCEDGPSCSDQVWIEAYRSDTTLGLLLSRINKHWTVGSVQWWWLDYENLQARVHVLDWQTYRKEEEALKDRFPACDAQPELPGSAPEPPSRAPTPQPPTDPK